MKQVFIAGFLMPFVFMALMVVTLVIFIFIGGPIALILNLEGTIPRNAEFALAFLWLCVSGGLIFVGLAWLSRGRK